MDLEQISYAKTVYGQDEIDAVVRCLSESTQMGKYSQELEQKIANLFEKKYSLYVNSGSSALYIGIEAFSFPHGSEVITPSLTFSTTVGCLLKNGLVPAFVDVEPLTYCIDTKQIEELVSEKTVAILAPNLLGNICDWLEIKRIAAKHGLKVIEDSADTIGATVNGISTGHYSDMSITSFYGSHIINCAGNGGALALNDKTLLEESKLLRSWGRRSSLFDEHSESVENRFNVNLEGIEYDSKFVFERIGYNLEGNELGAAFGLVQLKQLAENIKNRQKNFIKQYKFFEGHSDFFINPKQLENSNTAWLAYPILLTPECPFTRRELQIYLETRNIQTRVIFTGNILRQPMCKGINKVKRELGYPNSDSVMERGVLLPVHHGMTEPMFERLHSTINDFLKDYL